MKSAPVVLSPAQKGALKSLEHGLTVGDVVSLWGAPGMGKTTVLRELQRRKGGAWIGAREFATAAREGAPNGLEESFARVIGTAAERSEIVIVDDISAVDLGAHSCGNYPRSIYWDLLAEAFVEETQARGRKLVIGKSGREPAALRKCAMSWGIQRFEVKDYEALLTNFLGQAAKGLDVRKIFRFAPRLDVYDLESACRWLSSDGDDFSTDEFIDYLKSQRLASNVELGEVRAVELRSLIGVDDVIKSLETHIALPLENDALASELSLRAKRGVLLYGPPGTGKTTVGRALAHRLKGKFFLIDGTFIAGSNQFYSRVHEVFEAAKENAPAVIFIDDADAIFQNNEEQGLYRYLLTMLDGLESEGSAQVCVMMTAMNLGDLPPALVRSGRVELWLGMRLPDADARRRILEGITTELPEFLRSVDPEAVVEASDGLTGADLKRMLEDAKAIYAYAKSQNAGVKDATEYFLEALSAIRANKALYEQARAESPEAARPSSAMPYFPANFVSFMQSRMKAE